MPVASKTDLHVSTANLNVDTSTSTISPNAGSPATVAASTVGVGDFDHNDVSDIMWLNTSTGHIENWLLALS